MQTQTIIERAETHIKQDHSAVGKSHDIKVISTWSATSTPTSTKKTHVLRFLENLDFTHFSNPHHHINLWRKEWKKWYSFACSLTKYLKMVQYCKLSHKKTQYMLVVKSNCVPIGLEMIIVQKIEISCLKRVDCCVFITKDEQFVLEILLEIAVLYFFLFFFFVFFNNYFLINK